MSNLSLVSPGYNLTSTLLEIKLSIPITQDIPTIVVYPFLELANQDKTNIYLPCSLRLEQSSFDFKDTIFLSIFKAKQKAFLKIFTNFNEF